MSETPDLQTIMQSAMTLQENMQKMQNQLAHTYYEASDKQQLVHISANGKGQVAEVKLADNCTA